MLDHFVAFLVTMVRKQPLSRLEIIQKLLSNVCIDFRVPGCVRDSSE
jgi:hypothetical protein